MIFDHLLSFLTNIEEFQRILSNLKRSTREELISGIASSQRSYLIASLYRLMDDKNILVLTSNSRQAELWYNDLCTFLSHNEVLIFPPIEIMAHEGTEGNTELLSKRATVIKRLREGKKSIIIVPANSLVQKLIPYERYEENIITLKSGVEYDRDTLLLQLTNIGYNKADLVEEKGDFSVRGGIIDIFPLTNTLPVRIEFFGDGIESIRHFDLYTQRSIRNVELVIITPAIEGFIPKDSRENGVKRIEKEATELLNGLRRIGKRKELQVLEEKFQADLERLREGIYFNGVSGYKPYFHKRLETILDYFHEAFLVLDEPARFGEEIQNLSLQFGETHGSLLEHGSVLPSQFDNYSDYDEILQSHPI
jgi:transcription-repair coupling factor (superfamily II helicase)